MLQESIDIATEDMDMLIPISEKPIIGIAFRRTTIRQLNSGLEDSQAKNINIVIEFDIVSESTPRYITTGLWLMYSQGKPTSADPVCTPMSFSEIIEKLGLDLNSVKQALRDELDGIIKLPWNPKRFVKQLNFE